MSSRNPNVNKAVVKAAMVRAVEKRYRPIRCYKYVLEITTSDKSRYVIYRTISEFFELQIKLIEAFPIETGLLGKPQQTIPLLQSSSILQRNEVHQAVARRRVEIVNYLKKLVNCETRILLFPELRAFFSLRHDDLETDHQSKKKKRGMLQILSDKLFRRKKKKASTTITSNDVEVEITGPVQLETYIAIADYKASGKGQISLEEGEVVNVIDKNPNGWWYITAHGNEGWGPASYLDKVSSGRDEGSDSDEIPCLQGERYLSIKAYKADMSDELSFPENVVLEILNKVLDGWWIASYDGSVGYIPSMYLKIYKNPYLDSEIQPTTVTNTDMQQAPRRQSIKHRPIQIKKRDLQPYRRATEKRRQRSIKQIHREKVDLSFDFGTLLEEEPSSDAQNSPVGPTIEQPVIPSLPAKRRNLEGQKMSEKVAGQSDCMVLESNTTHRKPSPEPSSKLKTLVPPPPPRGNLATKLIQQDCTDYEYQPIEDIDLHPPTRPRRAVMPNLADSVNNNDNNSMSAETECRMQYKSDKKGSDEETHTEPTTGLPDKPRGVAHPPPPPRGNLATRLSQQGSDYEYHYIETLLSKPTPKERSLPKVTSNHVIEDSEAVEIET